MRARAYRAMGLLMLAVHLLVPPPLSGSVMAYGTPQWKMILHEDFHKGTVEGWRNSGAQQPLPADNGVRLRSYAAFALHSLTCWRPMLWRSQVSTCTYHPHANSDFYLGNYGNMEAGKVGCSEPPALRHSLPDRPPRA